MFLFQDTYPIFTLMHPSYVPFPRYYPIFTLMHPFFFLFRKWCVLKVRGEFKSKPNCFNSSTLLKLGSLFFNILDIDVADVDIHFCSVVDPKLLFSDLDPALGLISDPDSDPACLTKVIRLYLICPQESIAQRFPATSEDDHRT
jgi:hypothetical protein